VGKMAARTGTLTLMVDPAGKPEGQETGRGSLIDEPLSRGVT
jgi:hypothetical protein